MFTVDRKLRVFLCHVKDDKPIVRGLYRQLTSELWIDVWLDEINLFPGQEWDIEIEKAVEQADTVIVFLSNKSVDKEGYIQKELRFVLNVADEKPEGTIFVIPLRLDDCTVPRRIRAWQYVDYFPQNNQAWAYQRLIESLKLRAGKLGISINHSGNLTYVSDKLKDTTGRIFISYSHKDKQYVHKFQEILQNEGFEVWIDDRLDYDEEWPTEIEHRLDQSDVFILIASDNAKKSNWVQNEIRRAERLGKPFFPFLFQGDPWPGVEPQWFDVRDGSLVDETIFNVLAKYTKRKKLFSTTNLIPSQFLYHLIGRREYLNKFTDVLYQINKGKQISSNLFEWYGSPGIGKSSLVSMLVAQTKEKHAYHVIVNFQRLPHSEIKIYLYDPVIFIEEIVSDLRQQVAFDTYEFDMALKGYKGTSLPDKGVVPAYSVMDQETRLYRNPNWLTELRNVVIAFTKLINTLAAPRKTDSICPVVLFFDEAESANSEFIDWVEEWIINPLIQVNHCVIVWTARRPWRWKRFEVRRRLTSEKLNVFDLNEVGEQIQFEGQKPDFAKDLSNQVYSLTGGHPYANQIVINNLNALANQGVNVTPNNFQDFEHKLLEKVFDQFIVQYAFRELESNDLIIACKFISLVRLFDSTILKIILRACRDDLFSTWERDDFDDLLLKLKTTHLLVWEKGYALDSGLRYIIQNYFIVLEPDNFIKANQAALQVYNDWLERPVDNRGLFVLEELYHYAALSLVGENIDMTAILGKRLAEYPNWIRDEQTLDNALERLESELANDQELTRLTLSTKKLVEQVQAFRGSR